SIALEKTLEKALQVGVQCLDVIAAFLDNHGRQSKRTNGIAQTLKARRTDRDLGLRVFHVDIKAQTQYQRIRIVYLYGGQGFLEPVKEDGLGRIMGHGKVQIEAHSLACATLIFKARDNRIEVGGVPMDGDIDDVITLIEDLLNALPVVHVRIQNDHTLVRLPQHLAGNGRVVQITKAACS